MTQRLMARFITDDNRRWWTLGAMCFALFMLMLDNTVVNVALPSIQRDLGGSFSGLEWTVNAYTLSLAVMLVTSGRLGDLFGRRLVFLVGVGAFAGSSAFIGLAQSEAWLVGGRVTQGLGAALMLPATLSIITNAFPPDERGKAMGTWAGVSAVALSIGPVVGGFMVESVSWQSIFYLNLPVAALAVVVTLFAVPESRDESASASVDLPGVATITVGLAALVLSVVEANGWGWGSTRILALFGLAVVGLAAFVTVERRVSNPMVDFRFFRSKSFVGAWMVAFIVTFSTMAVYLFVALYLQNIRGYSPLQAGLHFLPVTLMTIVAGPISGRLTDRLGPRPLMMAGLGVIATSVVLQSVLTTSRSYALLVIPFMLMGLGPGLAITAMTSAAMNAIDERKAGVASGVLTTGRTVGGCFGVATIGALVTALGGHRLAHLLPEATAAERHDLAAHLASGGAQGGTGAVHEAVQEAFVFALNTGLRVIAALCALGMLLTWLLIAPGASRRPKATATGAGETDVRPADGGLAKA